MSHSIAENRKTKAGSTRCALARNASCVRRIVAAVFVSAAPLTFAQTTSQDPDTLVRFNLSPPGARSLSMGGAFLGLADDATAAYTNPAGLTNLTWKGTEVALELRRYSFVNSFLDHGRGLGETTGIGIDTVDGFQRGQTESTVNGVSFLSFGYVVPKSGLTVALYAHQLADFEAAFETQGAFFSLGDGVDRRFLPRRSRTDLDIVNYGFSLAYEFTKRSSNDAQKTDDPDAPEGTGFSVGLGLSYYEMNLHTVDEFFDLDLDAGEISRRPGFFYGPPDFTNDNVVAGQEQLGDDRALGVNLGILWKIDPARRWSLGAVFRQGPKLETSSESFICEPRTFPPNPSCPFSESSPGTIHVPDVYGLGVAYRTAGGRTKVAFDVNRVRYSQRLDDFVPRGGLVPDRADFRMEDAVELHLGIEHIFMVFEHFVATARAGVWNDPFHELEYLGQDEVLREFLRRSTDDEVHFSLGLGLVIKEDYQADVAVDFSDDGDVLSFSLVTFF